MSKILQSAEFTNAKVNVRTVKKFTMNELLSANYVITRELYARMKILGDRRIPR